MLSVADTSLIFQVSCDAAVGTTDNASPNGRVVPVCDPPNRQCDFWQVEFASNDATG